ncbi:glycosyltransferase family 4 protein [Leptolyngbya sp. FACHB-261]|uniref:glycosyltransferase family 4 protein n=1 Tax=Leptolyngbya sp. FACHB-261 TaxID=2692806 RepID=UPI001687ADDB|nr:glycosyltransferase family 4 protein [Leptolyngbya sp. FACHB-261]MBD2101092.1 glycosyltransferase family 4 protein [Leptolyngbya sp. FACHB-261]
MWIAQIAPLWEPVPPSGYGGVELAVSLLTEELVRRGHEVTLFASGDSKTRATLCAPCSYSLRQDSGVKDYRAFEVLQLSQAYGKLHQFDILHSHVDHSALALAELVKTPTLHTLHHMFTPETELVFNQFAHQPYVSVSEAQRNPCPRLNYISTVHNGIDPAAYPFRATAQRPAYLAFVGRMSREKGPHLAIQVAKEAGLPLLMAGKVDASNRDFFHDVLHPQIDGKQITYLGEVSRAEKNELLGGALATLCPITRPQPFGLGMIESMACGTPVLAMRQGAAPELVAHGQTGFLANEVTEMVDFIGPASLLSRANCREHVVNQFSVQRMVDRYEAAYRQVIDERMASNGKLKSAPVLVA